MLVYYLKPNHPHIKKLIYFSYSCIGQYKNYKSFIEERLCSHKHNFNISAEWISTPCNDIGGAVKMKCSKAKPWKVFE